MVVEIALRNDPRSKVGTFCMKCSSLITCRDLVIDPIKKEYRPFGRVCCANKEQCFDVECPEPSEAEKANIKEKQKESSRPCALQLKICKNGKCNQRCAWMACKACCKEKCVNEKRLCGGHTKYKRLDIREVFVEKNGYPGTLWKDDAELGSGSFADVHLGQWGLEQVAIKSFKIKPGSDNADFIHHKRIESEVQVWSKLNSGHIVPLWATTGNDGHISALVTPLYGNGTLEDFLKKGENQGANRLQLLIDAASGLYDVHRMNAYHGDITLRNILVDHDGRAALADFGLSRLSEQAGYSTLNGGLGCPVYRAPECFVEGGLSGDPKARASRDVWAFAIVIVEVLTQMKPYDNHMEAAEVKNCLQSGGRPYSPEQLAYLPGASLANIIWMSWDTVPSERPKIPQFLETLRSLATAWGISLAPAKASDTMDCY